MREYMVTYIPWLLMIMALYSKWVIGNKNKNGWIIGIVKNLVWFMWVWSSCSWSLIPLTILTMILSITNYFKWSKDEKEQSNEFDIATITRATHSTR